MGWEEEEGRRDDNLGWREGVIRQKKYVFTVTC